MAMRIPRRSLLTFAALAPVLARASAAADPISVSMERIRPLFWPKIAARPGDWLTSHHEPGQTYAQFRDLTAIPAVQSFDTIRILPIGPLSKGQLQVLDVVQDFLGPFFGLRLTIEPTFPLTDIPATAQRVFAPASPRQLLTSYLLNEVLKNFRQPEDAAVLGITALDLWPGAGWNFVFGQASLADRVGVWSMARNGDADGRPAMRKLCALRTAMTATHETGHMFGIRHCIAYECGMNGSNNAAERDRQPLEFCPECQAKLWWTCGLDALKRCESLATVAQRHGYDALARNFLKQAGAMQGK